VAARLQHAEKSVVFDFPTRSKRAVTGISDSHFNRGRIATMSQQLGPIDICCDAPPYPVVRACSQIGIETPEDVRWCQLNQSLSVPAAWRHIAQFAPWNVFLPANQTDVLCNCGGRMPGLRQYTFTFNNDDELCLALVQCPRCRTVYWEDLGN